MAQFSSALLIELQARGLIADCTDAAGLDRFLDQGNKLTVYAGFDPTGVGLHVGHLIALQVLNIFSRHGHKAIALLGGATAQVGDPTGRTAARPRLAPDRLAANKTGVKADILRAAPGVELVDNEAWMSGMCFMSFMLEVGSVMSLGHLLSLETIAKRVEDRNAGISVLEAVYPLIQGYDFLHLSRLHGPMVQIGGSDQWGNITTGLTMIRKLGGQDGSKPDPAWGLTAPLLCKSDGTKMGKTADGAVWLSPERLEDLDLFQFWRNVDDEEAIRFARIFLPLDRFAEIAAVEAALAAGKSGAPSASGEPTSPAAINALKESLAHAATAAARSGQAADRALAAVKAAFGRGGDQSALPSFTVTPQQLRDPALLLRDLGLSPSRNEARRLIAQGGVRLNGEKLTSDAVILEEALQDQGGHLSLGKHRHYRLILDNLSGIT
mgnify:CR=1 FL=1